MLKKIAFALMIVLFSLSISSAEYYAVLITGDDPSTGDPPGVDRFWNDTFLMWETLWQAGWKDENIYVLFAGGEDWEVDYDRYDAEAQNQINENHPDHIVDDSCFESDIEDTFDYLDGIMTEDDFLFVWVMCHGTWLNIYTPPDDTCAIIVYPPYSNEITDQEFAAMLPSEYDKRVIWLTQCHAGGFVNYLDNFNSVVLAAVEKECESYRADDDEPDGGDDLENEAYEYEPGMYDYYRHMEFNYHIMNALRFETIGEFNAFDDHDLNSDGLASMDEIYYWDSLKVSTPYEEPVYDDDGNIGDEIFLNIPPYAPQNLELEEVDQEAHLTWDHNIEYDLDFYNVYRYIPTDQGDPPANWPLLGTTTDNEFTDEEFYPRPGGPESAMYRISAVDNAGQESDYSDTVGSHGYIIENSDGTLTAAPTPETYTLSISPNPFNASATLSFNLPASGRVELKVYDVRGREVASLVNGHLSSGEHQAVWDADALPSGVYFARLTAGGEIHTQKLLLVK